MSDSMLTIDEISHEISNRIGVCKIESENKIDEFVKTFNEKYPQSNPRIQGMATALTWSLLDTPIILYALGLNGQAIIELYSKLERWTIRDFVNQVAKDEYKDIVLDIVEKTSTENIARKMLGLKRLEASDVKFLEKLLAIRNGAAHKNPGKISNLFCSGKKIHPVEIDTELNKVDCLPYLFGGLEYLIHLCDSAIDKKHKSASF